MKLQIELRDLRKVLSEKCLEIFPDKKLAEALYCNIAEIEDDERFTEIWDTGDKHMLEKQEHKTGHWENGHCTCCGEDIASKLDTWTNVQTFSFCPKCGAEMEVKRDD